jgi:hypothetical protein
LESAAPSLKSVKSMVVCLVRISCDDVEIELWKGEASEEEEDIDIGKHEAARGSCQVYS